MREERGKRREVKVGVGKVKMEGRSVRWEELERDIIKKGTERRKRGRRRGKKEGENGR